MEQDAPPELLAILAWAKSSGLPSPAQATITWCVGQLPGLARAFATTYESRHAAEVVRLERAMLQAAQEAGPGLADALLERLRPLHERLGLPPVDPKALPRKRRKAA
jgi:hypothetical protein